MFIAVFLCVGLFILLFICVCSACLRACFFVSLSLFFVCLCLNLVVLECIRVLSVFVWTRACVFSSPFCVGACCAPRNSKLHNALLVTVDGSSTGA